MTTRVLRMDDDKGATHGGRQGRYAWRWRVMLAMRATAISETISEVPPKDMKGSGTPVTGQDDVTTPMLMKAWITIMNVIQAFINIGVETWYNIAPIVTKGPAW